MLIRKYIVKELDNCELRTPYGLNEDGVNTPIFKGNGYNSKFEAENAILNYLKALCEKNGGNLEYEPNLMVFEVMGYSTSDEIPWD